MLEDIKMSKEDAVLYYPHGLAMGMERLASKGAEYSNAEAQEKMQEYSRMCVHYVMQNHRKPEEAVLMGMGVMRRLVCNGELIFQANPKVPNILRISYSGDMGTLIGAFVVALASYLEGGGRCARRAGRYLLVTASRLRRPKNPRGWLRLSPWPPSP